MFFHFRAEESESSVLPLEIFTTYYGKEKKSEEGKEDNKEEKSCEAQKTSLVSRKNRRPSADGFVLLEHVW